MLLVSTGVLAPTFHRFSRSVQVTCSYVSLFHGPRLIFIAGMDTLTETFTLVGGPVDENLGGYDVAKRYERVHEVGVPKVLRQVIDEQVAALGS